MSPCRNSSTYRCFLVLGWIVYHNPVGIELEAVGVHALVLGHFAYVRPEARVTLSGRPNSFVQLMKYERVVRQRLHNSRAVQRAFPFHSNCWIPKVLAQLVTGDTLFILFVLVVVVVVDLFYLCYFFSFIV